MEDMLDRMNGAKVFSIVDWKAGHHQIRMRPDDIEKTAFQFEQGYENDSVVRREEGYFNKGVWTVTGYCSWVDPDGHFHEFSFTADDKGFRILPDVPGEGASITAMSTKFRTSLLAYCALLIAASCRSIDGIQREFGIDNYSFSYKNDSVVRREEGYFNKGVWTVTGYCSWVDPDGHFHEFSFTADDKGFRILPENLYRELNKLMSEDLQDIQSQKGGELHVPIFVIYQASLLAFFTLLLTAKCRPIDDFDVNSYSFRYESKGVVRSEYGYFNGGIWTVVGYYTWLDPDGQLHRFSFTADDKGFRILPVGTPTGLGSLEANHLDW
ncbi:hypothetical protein AAG570_003414 [Ranatra chinensis]|uniref:Uncharacterized protein n=1 Tax=Ranatra chinensis TaxID=642074 RepID=A0ABD0YG42_9HEMI